MLSLLHPLSHLGTDKDPHFADEETEARRGEVVFVMYPTAIFSLRAGTYLKAKLISKTSPWQRNCGYVCPASDVETLSWLRVGGLTGVSGWSDGISRKSLAHTSTHPQRGKTANLEICGGKAQLTLSYKHGRHRLHLQRKEQGFSKLYVGSSVAQKHKGPS